MTPAQIPLQCRRGAKRPLQQAVWPAHAEEKKCEKYSPGTQLSLSACGDGGFRGDWKHGLNGHIWTGDFLAAGLIIIVDLVANPASETQAFIILLQLRIFLKEISNIILGRKI